MSISEEVARFFEFTAPKYDHKIGYHGGLEYRKTGAGVPFLTDGKEIVWAQDYVGKYYTDGKDKRLVVLLRFSGGIECHVPSINPITGRLDRISRLNLSNISMANRTIEESDLTKEIAPTLYDFLIKYETNIPPEHRIISLQDYWKDSEDRATQEDIITTLQNHADMLRSTS